MPGLVQVTGRSPQKERAVHPPELVEQAGQVRSERVVVVEVVRREIGVAVAAQVRRDAVGKAVRANGLAGRCLDSVQR
ncbi:hypothetical protein [Streptomyces sp. SID13031]|uniref:hypothetical protein n=1 Tax=Streptomyces sp. SID13031 TaxID=2706046 RepID=UPI0013CC4AA4|nr:hypothetical protein [Streptomyces sp. SID13031]NEA34839.1 hypothetical protein [Streptomyces sp. SID13031]